MKKLIVMLTVCTFAMASKVLAQGAGKVSLQDLHMVLKEGSNNLATVDGRTTLKIVKKGETFSEVQVTDAAGKTTRLVPARGVIKGAPVADCNSGSAVQYFNNAANNIGLIICTGEPTATGGQAMKYFKLDQPGTTGKAQNRRVEVKLSK